MDSSVRNAFDERLESVLADLPEWIHGLLAEVPLHVEDYPPRDVLQQFGMNHRDQLCGLYTGVPLSDRSVAQGWRLPDAVTIYREGILGLADDGRGNVSLGELERQIRITVLHELGHHHGLEEDDLTKLGYG